MRADRPNDVQVLFVEMQPEIVAASGTWDARLLGRSAAAICQIAEAMAIPVTASTVPVGEAAPRLIEELESFASYTRTTVSALGDPDCRGRLEGHDRRIIALAGVSMEIAILATALDARRRGYEIAVLIDACGGLDQRTEATAIEQMRAAGVIVTNVSSFFTGMFTDLTSPEGQAVMSALAALWGWNGDADDATGSV